MSRSKYCSGRLPYLINFIISAWAQSCASLTGVHFISIGPLKDLPKIVISVLANITDLCKRSERQQLLMYCKLLKTIMGFYN